MVQFPVSLHLSRLFPALTLACALGLTSCAKPDRGMMFEKAPAPKGDVEEGEGQEKVRPNPSDEPEEYEGHESGDDELESDEAAPLPKPLGPVMPTPTISPKPWMPWSPWNPTPVAKPSPTPIAKPSPKPPTSTWPTPKPAIKPSPSPFPTPAPARPTVGPWTSLLEVKASLFSFFTRPWGQSVGKPDHGNLERSDELPASGEGFLKIFQERDRAYGSMDMISILQSSAKEIRREYPATEVVQIGDISRKEGGLIRGHASHQIGVDVDIAYFRKNHRVMDPRHTDKSVTTGFDEQFVRNGAVTANFDLETNWKFIQLLDSTGRLNRVFTDRKLKQAFCEYAIAKGMRQAWGETLRKLRHWAKHADHMHVRLHCPPNSTKCKPSAPLPAGDGCAPLVETKYRGIIRMNGVLTDDVATDESENEAGVEGC